MPPRCVVEGCNKLEDNSSLHRFPKDDASLRIWKEALQKPVEWFPIDSDRVCTRHFDPSVVTRCGTRTRLLECAVPRITPHQRDAISEAAALFHHDYALPSSTTLKRRLDVLLDKVESDDRKKRKSYMRETRLKLTLASALHDLRDQCAISQEVQMKLQAFSDIPVELFSRHVSEYTEEQRDFALTLHMYSAKTYEFVRASGVPLPHPRSLARWMTSIDDKPGFSEPMLKCLAEKCQINPEQYQDCTLCIDGMSIKQQITFDQASGTMIGFEDFGNDEEGEEEAKEAVVFMLVGVRGHWKAPIGYFLTKRLTAEGQKQLLLNALTLLEERSVTVLTVVMDGHGMNVGMYGLLGGTARADDVMSLKTSFRHPTTGKEIYMMFDACHMLKLIRNMLYKYATIKSPDGLVSWKYIALLHKYQEEDGLRLANRLSGSHVSFENCKMRVSTAAQTLSR